MFVRFRSAVLICAIGIWSLYPTTGAAQEIVKFEATDPYASDKVVLRAELFKPDGAGPFPAVILMHGCGGWQPAVRYSLHTHADYLVKNGYVVLSLDSFGPRGYSGDDLCASNARLRDAIDYRTHDAFDALRYLQALSFVDAADIFLMGQSNGGSVAMQAAKAIGPTDYNKSHTAFRAVAAYYPWCGIFADSRQALASPLMVFAGGKDDWVSARECSNLRAEGADFQVVVYPEAPHSFDLDIIPQRYLGHMIGNDAQAAKNSEERMLTFFDDHLTADLKRERLMAAKTTETTEVR